MFTHIEEENLLSHLLKPLEAIMNELTMADTVKRLVDVQYDQLNKLLEMEAFVEKVNKFYLEHKEEHTIGSMAFVILKEITNNLNPVPGYEDLKYLVRKHIGPLIDPRCL